LAAWEENKQELDELGATIYAVSADTLEETMNSDSRNVSFNLAYGATRGDCDAIGAWWSAPGDVRNYIQSSEFIISKGGIVLGSMYASGPIGRFSPQEATRLIQSREKRRLEQGH
jgi:peroxiredoxin